MKTKIEIEKINYFGESTGTQDFNAKVLYRKNGKTYLAYVFIDFFNRRVHEGKNNPREHKVLSGVMSAVNDFAKQTNWRLS